MSHAAASGPPAALPPPAGGSRQPRRAAGLRERFSLFERIAPAPLRRYILHFESAIDDAVNELARVLAVGARVLDAGAGECRHAACFPRQSYIAVDLAVGDPGWDYGRLSCRADLARLPFPDATFQACLNIVTLEHVPEPGAVMSELARVLAPGGRLLLVVPHEWEVHQSPYDFYRYTRHGAAHLLRSAGFQEFDIRPIGGFFRLLSRRLWNALQFFPGLTVLPAALLLVPPALILPLLDGLDRERNFTLGYLCTAQKPS